MANDISGRPWVIDTPGATTIKSGQTYVKGITFSGYAAATDQAIVKFLAPSGSTNILCTLQGKTDLSPVYFNLAAPEWVRNISVSTLTSGRVSIHV